MKAPYELRFYARRHIGENFKRILLVSLIATAIFFGISVLTSNTSGYAEWIRAGAANTDKMSEWMLSYRDAISKNDSAALEALMKERPIPPYPNVPVLGIVLTALLKVCEAVLRAGYSGFFLQRARGADAGVRDLFPSFMSGVRILILNLLVSLAVALGYVLLIIPGVILSYRYRLVYFVMFDNPDMGVFACMRESGRLMRGNKLRLFRLDLSFLGWELLSALVTLMFLPVLDLWLTPYIGLSRAYFYTDLVPNGQYGKTAQ